MMRDMLIATGCVTSRESHGVHSGRKERKRYSQIW